MNLNGAHLEDEWFDCDGLFKKMFTVQGNKKCERGPKKLHKHL